MEKACLLAIAVLVFYLSIQTVQVQGKTESYNCICLSTRERDVLKVDITHTYKGLVYMSNLIRTNF